MTTPAPRYLLDRDDDGHWFLIPEGQHEAFDAYVDDPYSDLPTGVIRIDHPNGITFEAPAESGKPVGA